MLTVSNKGNRTGALGRSSAMRRFMAMQRAHKIKMRRLNSCDQQKCFGLGYGASIRVKPEESA